MFFVAVPDQALPRVAAHLGELLAVCPRAVQPVVAHTSGATSVEVLRSCEKAGAATLVFHPLQTFSDPSTAWTRFAGAAVAITPSVSAAGSANAALVFSLAQLLGARPFLLPDDKRALYHAAAAMACNYLVTLEHDAQRLFVKAGLPETEALSLFLPLVRTTLENIGTQGTVDALTGPLSRGDTGTVANHLTALADGAPDVLPLYRILGLRTLELVRARGHADPSLIAALADLLQTA